MKQQVEALKTVLAQKIEEEQQAASNSTTATARNYHSTRASAFGWCYNEIVYLLMLCTPTPSQKPGTETS